MRSSLPVLLLALTLCPSGALAGAKKPGAEPKKPMTTEQAADAVSEAVKAKDDKALETIADKETPDPWLVADLLWVRGDRDEARALARAATRPDTRSLAAYLAKRREDKPDGRARAALEKAWAGFARGDAGAVLAAVVAAGEPGEGIVATRLNLCRGYALRMRGKPTESHAALRAGAEQAYRRALEIAETAGISLQAMDALDKLATLHAGLRLAREPQSPGHAARDRAAAGLETGRGGSACGGDHGPAGRSAGPHEGPPAGSTRAPQGAS